MCEKEVSKNCPQITKNYFTFGIQRKVNLVPLVFSVLTSNFTQHEFTILMKLFISFAYLKWLLYHVNNRVTSNE